MKKVFEREHKLENKVVELEKDIVSLIRVTIEGLEDLQDELVRQGKHIRNLTARVRKIELTLEHMDYHITNNPNAIRFLSNMFGILLSDLNRHLMLYESIVSELDHFLDALDNLSNNQLSHSVILPNVMNTLIIHVKEVLSTRYPSYELVVSEVHDYYNLPFTTFACKDNTLIIHISFYIKPLLMYDIKTINVPYHMSEELIDESESKDTYTKIKPSTEILAMGSNIQVNLDYNQLVHCIQ